MNKNRNVIIIISFILIVFVCWTDNNRVKQINELKSDLEITKDELANEKDNNLYLNYKLCELKQNPDADCEKITKEIKIQLYIVDELGKVIKDNVK